MTTHFTDEQLNELKNVLYMISDAREGLRQLNANMKRNEQWRAQADVAHLVNQLDDISGPDTFLGAMLREL